MLFFSSQPVVDEKRLQDDQNEEKESANGWRQRKDVDEQETDEENDEDLHVAVEHGPYTRFIFGVTRRAAERLAAWLYGTIGVNRSSAWTYFVSQGCVFRVLESMVGQVWEDGHVNRLIHEKSPYLLQHAGNPVDWYPWGELALGKARAEKKPILLSVGYSACHWCRVMERESFEDDEIAAIMNEHFVNIKVDREERPDIDHIYQTAAQLLTGQGGWPLTVFLTPDQRPFYAGAYFPPHDRYGRPGFIKVLQSVVQSYNEDRDRIERAAKQMTAALVQIDRRSRDQRSPIPSEQGQPLIDKSVDWLVSYMDESHGGFGTQPKFPNPTALELLLRYAARNPGASKCRRLTLLTLDKMAGGGIYDQLGGGFHRYATDAAWTVPHFEKMLYDNAQLSMVYLQGYQLTKEDRYAHVVRETLSYVEREMSHPDGGFFSSQDADSEGVEGKCFVWRPEEFDAALGEGAELLKERFGVTPRGNFEGGLSVLRVAKDEAALAKALNLDLQTVLERLTAGKAKLLEQRERRVRPGRDEKVILAWNALMISAFARASRVLGSPEYLDRACRAARFIRENMVRGDRLVRSFKDGPAGIPGFLEDYVFWTQALLDIYESGFDRTYLNEAARWMDVALELFWDEESPGFFLTPADHDGLIHRPKDWRDQSIPSGTGIAVQSLLRLHPAFDGRGYLDLAERVLETYRRQMDQNPWGTASLTLAYDGWVNGATEVVIVARRDQRREVEPFVRALGGAYVPHGVFHLIEPDEALTAANDLWKGKRQRSGEVTAYVCRGFVCSAPIVEAAQLTRLL